MSHELRTPLSAILGFAQLIQSGMPPPSPSQLRSTDQILKAGWYLLDLINEILDLALIESGKLLLALVPVSLEKVVLECQDMIEQQAQQHEISMIFPTFESDCVVSADRMRLKQALINLLSNAIKYNRPGGSVRVSCAATTPGHVRISVEDTGEGLSVDKLTQLFQPFNRLGQETGAEEGTGIGLVVCKQLVELMGGILGVVSTPGKGSVFWIELRLADDVPISKPATVCAPPAIALDQPQQCTMLYVEDHAANRMLVEMLMERRPDIRLLCAVDGASGIQMAQETQPDIILMDINLPDISGIQALQILAKDPATEHIPVIALSANAMPRDIQNGLEAGFLNYLTKPIKLKEFMDTVDITLQFAQTEAARPAKLAR
jgi:CheY-like chemotaxis protein